LLKETAKKYWTKEYDLNCAECIMYAANEEYNLNLSHETFKTMAGFGGGMASGSVCGAISGAVAVLGIMFTEERGHKSPKLRAMTQEFIKRFKEEMGYIDCRDLKTKIVNPEDKSCSRMIEVSAEILESIIKKG
jgi:C_GCAxxG_C_C family probable redox protein